MVMMTSTKHFPSFFICLVVVLCIAHSSHSLASSHTIHKRMENVREVASDMACKGVTSDGGSAKSDSFDASRDIRSTSSKRFSSDPLAQESLHSTPSPAKRIRKEYRPSSDEEIDALPKRLLEEHSAIESVDPDFYQNLNPKVKASLNHLKAFREELNEIDERMTQNQQKIADNIQPLLSAKGDSSSVEILAKRMAAFNAKALASDRKILQDHLPEEEKYLSILVGFMGPDVLRPLFRSELEDYLMKEKSFSKDYAKSKSNLLWYDLRDVQLALDQLAKFYKLHDISKIKQDTPEIQEYEYLKRSLDDLVDTLLLFFDDTDDMEKSIKKLQDEIFHEYFMQELENPTSLIGYQLQFLQPWGYLHSHGKVPTGVDSLIYDGFGIGRDQNHLQKIAQQGDIVRDDLKKVVELFEKIRKESKNMKELLTPEELEIIQKHFNKDSSV